MERWLPASREVIRTGEGASNEEFCGLLERCHVLWQEDSAGCEGWELETAG